MNDGAIKSSMRHLSMLGAWALAFGCAVGSDAFVMPWNDFLPKAGPLGTVIGIFIGGLVMAVVAWNFHYCIRGEGVWQRPWISVWRLSWLCLLCDHLS